MRTRAWAVLLLPLILLSNGCGGDDPPAAVEQAVEETQPKPLKHVYGYVYKTDLTKESMVKDLEREQLTAVALHAVYPDSSGNIPNGFDPAANSAVKNFVDKAHAHGVQVHINVALFSQSTTESVLQSYKTKMTNRIMEIVEETNLDGVALDFENIPKTDYYKDKFAGFVEMLSDKLRPKNLKLFIAVGNQPGGDDDPARLSAAADGLFIMGYAYSGPWSTVAGPTAPFTTGGKWWAAYTTFIFNPASDKTWIAAGVDPKKLILGVPFYGYRWQTQSLGIKAKVVSGTAKALTQSYIVSQYGRIWDGYSQTPYYEWIADGKYYQVWYDDPESYAIKFAAANEYGFGGVGAWKLPWATDAVWAEIQKYQAAD